MHTVPSNTVSDMAADGAVSHMKMREHKVSFTHSSTIILLAFEWMGAVHELMRLLMPLPVMDLLKRTQLLTLRFSQLFTKLWIVIHFMECQTQIERSLSTLNIP